MPISGLSFAIPRISGAERHLSDEINQLRDDLEKLSAEVLREREESQKWKEVAGEITRVMNELRQKEELRFVLDRIGEKPRQMLLKSGNFQDKFLNEDTCYAYVMSVDIRRSTELMLKARSPQLYAEFITELCARL